MRKFLTLVSILSVLAAGSASAQDFKVSNANAAPGDLGPSGHNAAPKNRGAGREVADREIITSNIGMPKAYNGYNASDDFVVSDD